MAVGFPVKADYVTGDVLTANNMNDLSGTLNTIQSVEYAAGKNKIINGNFGIWQRGTSFANPANEAYICDRFIISYDGSGATRTYSQQTFSPGSAPVAGYEGTYFLRYARTVAGSGATADRISQRIEDVRTFAGQTATMSFWAKVDSGTPTLTLRARQNFGSGGSALVDATDVSVTLSTSWTRYTATFAIPSISGKTIGTSSNLELQFRTALNTVQTLDLWGVQIEASTIASDFQTATGTIQGELAACQRYFYAVPSGNTKIIGTAFAYSTTEADIVLQFPVQMRTTPSYSNTSGTGYFRYFRNSGTDDFDGLTLAGESTSACGWLYNNTQISGTAGQAGLFQFNNASATMLFSAEL